MQKLGNKIAGKTTQQAGAAAGGSQPGMTRKASGGLIGLIGGTILGSDSCRAAERLTKKELKDAAARREGQLIAAAQGGKGDKKLSEQDKMSLKKQAERDVGLSGFTLTRLGVATGFSPKPTQGEPELEGHHQRSDGGGHGGFRIWSIAYQGVGWTQEGRHILSEKGTKDKEGKPVPSELDQAKAEMAKALKMSLGDITKELFTSAASLKKDAIWWR